MKSDIDTQIYAGPEPPGPAFSVGTNLFHVNLNITPDCQS